MSLALLSPHLFPFLSLNPLPLCRSLSMHHHIARVAFSGLCCFLRSPNSGLSGPGSVLQSLYSSLPIPVSVARSPCCSLCIPVSLFRPLCFFGQSWSRSQSLSSSPSSPNYRVPGISHLLLRSHTSYCLKCFFFFSPVVACSADVFSARNSSCSPMSLASPCWSTPSTTPSHQIAQKALCWGRSTPPTHHTSP